MQPIERYGLIALIFLVITIAAACLWDPQAEVAVADTEVAKATMERNAKPERGRDFVAGRTRPRRGQALSEKERDLTARGARNEVQAAGTQRPLVALGDDSQLPGSATAQEREGGSRTHLQDRAEDVLGTAVDRARDVADWLRAETPRPVKGTYEVRSGDTLSEISQRELGSARRWNEIVQLNPGLDPGRLRVGARLVMPATPGSVAADSPEPAPARAKAPAKRSGPTYVVRQDESLWKIAARTLGDGARWKEIADANPDINPDRISKGQTLVLPAGAELIEAGRPDRLARATPSAARGRVR